MKVVVKKKDNAIPVAITTEYIKLQDAMKLANATETGGEAKLMIQEGQILVNGEICQMRGNHFSMSCWGQRSSASARTVWLV